MRRSLSLLGIVFLVTTTAVSAQSPAPHTGHVMVTPNDLKWMDGPPTLPPGVKVALFEGNPAAAGPYTLRFQFPANYKVPAHWHPIDEHVTVISGTFYAGMGNKLSEAESKAFPAGSFVMMPAKTPHFAWTKEETVIQLHGVGPGGITYVDPADDPRQKK